MASKTNGADRLHYRRWTFAGCVFDEANWALLVDGRRVPIEIKPLELLRALLLRAGNAVTKEELLDAVWPDVEVVEASLTTAVRKLRTAIGDDRRRKPVIETVQRIGYRLAVPVQAEELPGPPEALITAVDPAPEPAHASTPPQQPATPRGRLLLYLLSLAGGILIGLAAMAMFVADNREPVAARPAAAPSQRQAAVAIRNLDIEAMERMIAAGWDPNTPWDEEGTDAFAMLLNRCEWDRGHDRRQMLMMARTLIEGGAKIDHRNVFGDTAYSIAKAPRYCGPDHEVTQMLEAMCYGGPVGPKDLCLATYELTAEQRRAQGLPPKG